jgi:hypothetical protein
MKFSWTIETALSFRMRGQTPWDLVSMLKYPRVSIISEPYTRTSSVTNIIRQNEEKGDLHGDRSRISCYPCRCPKPVRLEGSSSLRLASECIISDANTSSEEKVPIDLLAHLREDRSSPNWPLGSGITEFCLYIFQLVEWLFETITLRKDCMLSYK